jgi:hypothetical protein
MHLIAIGGYVQTHVVGIALSMLSTLFIGFMWHGPLFGRQWMKYNNIAPPKPEDMKFSMMLPGICSSALTAFVQAAVMGRTFQILMMPSIAYAFIIAIILWLPFTGLVIMSRYAWVGRPWGMLFLDAGFDLVSMLAIAAILYSTL